MALALLPFFHWFRGTPHQLAAIKELEERMPEDLLAEEDNVWFDMATRLLLKRKYRR